MKKFLLGIISFVLIFSLAACGEKKVEERENNNQNEVDNQENLDEVFYIINNNFMGSYDNGKWHSSRSLLNINTGSWKYNDLLNNNVLTLYGVQELNNNNIPMKKNVNRINVSLSDPGVGDFLCSDSFGEYGYSEDREKLREEFQSYTKVSEKNEYESVFTLPTHLGGNLENLETDYSNTWISFDDEYSIVTNAPYDFKFATKFEPGELTEKVKEYITNFILNNNLSDDIEYFCDLMQRADIDNDGLLDTILVINSKDTHDDDWENVLNYEKENGSFYLMIAELGNGEIKGILSDSLEKGRENEYYLGYHYGGKRIQNIIVVDLNNDNIYEVFAEDSDGGNYILSNMKGYYEIVAFNTHIN